MVRFGFRNNHKLGKAKENIMFWPKIPVLGTTNTVADAPTYRRKYIDFLFFVATNKVRDETQPSS